MIRLILEKIFKTKTERIVRGLRPLADEITALEPEMERLNDEAIAAQTRKFRERTEKGDDLDELLPEVFATVREVSRRTIGLRHFDVQLIGGMVLHQGKIAEMKTGEGKTLVATLPLVLNAMTGHGAHLVTVNDYLARRDATWMGPIYLALGLEVGVIQHEASFRLQWEPKVGKFGVKLVRCTRREAYAADVTYGTNNEFGFDYLRDNMKFSLEEYVQRELNYAIVDEVDSILVDEARTPLIISGPAEESTEKYYVINRIIPRLEKGEETKHPDGSKTYTGDFTVDEKARSVMLTEEGIAKVEKLLGVQNMYDPAHIDLVHHVDQALKAHELFKVDVDYVVKEGKVIIVDEFTGRLMPGRRWSDGLHQGVEAKEGLKIERENQTLATITFQNYFRMYDKLAGMTGTAATEAGEFEEIYKLEVVVIPTHRPMVRADYADVVYKNEKGKFAAIVEEIKDVHGHGQPVLVGTISIEKSELLSGMLRRDGIKHNVLNAKHHEREAEIVAQAGRKAAVTISTNMAGRGTDIVLGGNAEMLAAAVMKPNATPEEREEVVSRFKEQCAKEREEVVSAGGLHILGTERHEARRIDNQLRGRSGRQGDPGSSRFYLSLEDDLMRIFASDRVRSIMERFGLPDDEPIEHPWVTRAIANAQKKVEAHNFDIRKHLLEYDDVMNKQREVVYSYRRKLLDQTELKEEVERLAGDATDILVTRHIPAKGGRDLWNVDGLKMGLLKHFTVAADSRVAFDELQGQEAVNAEILDLVKSRYGEREQELGSPVLRQIERFILLNTLNQLWKDHLLSMDHLKDGIGLRGYGQKDPLREYQREAFELFEGMMESFALDSMEKLFKVQVRMPEKEVLHLHAPVARPAQTVESHPDSGGGVSADPPGPVPLSVGPRPLPLMGRPMRPPGPPRKVAPVKRDAPKVGRNDPCPCGSGQKFKKCHGR
ncbi:MAG: preprotein translocase subunit SecA [Nitrospirae bacterium]|nr:preprotein translocase subunit SecA [Nitrospirota bacterium]